MNLIKFFIIGITSIMFFTGCNLQDENHLAMPASARIAGDFIKIPFPYMESETKGQWKLNRDASNHFVIQITNNGKIIATFPLEQKVKDVYDYQNGKQSLQYDYLTHGIIELDGKKYNAFSITLNNDNQTGFVTLKFKK